MKSQQLGKTIAQRKAEKTQHDRSEIGRPRCREQEAPVPRDPRHHKKKYKEQAMPMIGAQGYCRGILGLGRTFQVFRSGVLFFLAFIALVTMARDLLAFCYFIFMGPYPNVRLFLYLNRFHMQQAFVKRLQENIYILTKHSSDDNIIFTI